MKKIPTIFIRDWDGDRSRVLDIKNPEADWVFADEGVARRKYDGTCCLVREGRLFRRREIKAEQPWPADFLSEGTDPETGKTVGWVPVGKGPEDALHREAFSKIDPTASGTYELVGPKVQGNPEHKSEHILIKHELAQIFWNAPRSFDGLQKWLAEQDIEGIVFHHPDGRMAKIKLRDFGLKRQARIPQ